MLLRTSLLAAAILLAAFSAAALGNAYTLTNLGTLGGNSTSATAINDSGQIVGGSADSSGNRYSFLYANGHMSALTTLGINAGARNINSSGQIEGNMPNADLFVYTNGTFVNYGIPLGGTTCKGYGFNDSGQITGQVRLSSGITHGFYFTPAGGGSSIDIGTLSGNSADISYGSSINALSQIEGDSTIVGGNTHAFIWTNGKFVDLGTLGGPDSSGICVNSAGHATGTSQLPGGTVSHVFFYDGTTMHDAGSLGGNFANANAMNNLNQIVGHSLLGDNVTQDAFVYTNGVMTDLNSLIPANSGWTLTTATDINNLGQIIADGVDSVGDQAAFLLTPTPEPRCVSFIVLAAVFMLQRRYR